MICLIRSHVTSLLLFLIFTSKFGIDWYAEVCFFVHIMQREKNIGIGACFVTHGNKNLCLIHCLDVMQKKYESHGEINETARA